MKRFIAVFVLVLLAISALSITCFGQGQKDVWDRNPEYEVLEDGSIYMGTVPVSDNDDSGYWSSGVKKFTPEEQEEYDRKWNEINGIQDSNTNQGSNTNSYYTDTYYSYSILGARTSASELLQAGCTQVDSNTWKYKKADNVDGYLWLTASIVSSEGMVFRNVDPSWKHVNIADYIVNNVEQGYIEKSVTCYSGSGSSICKNLKDSGADLFTFPTTVFDTIYPNVTCYLTQTTVFSKNNESQYFYICSIHS